MTLSGAITTILLGLCGLGAWQAYEHVQTEAKRAEIQAILEEPARPIEEVMRLPPDEWAYRRVVAMGRLDGRETYVTAQLIGKEEGAKVFNLLDLADTDINLMADTGYTPEPPMPGRAPREGDGKGTTAELTRFTGVLVPGTEASLLESADYDRMIFAVPDLADMTARRRQNAVTHTYLYLDGPRFRDRPFIPFEPSLPHWQMTAAIGCFAIATILGLGFFALVRTSEEEPEEEIAAPSVSLDRLPKSKKAAAAREPAPAPKRFSLDPPNREPTRAPDFDFSPDPPPFPTAAGQ